MNISVPDSILSDSSIDNCLNKTAYISARGNKSKAEKLILVNHKDRPNYICNRVSFALDTNEVVTLSGLEGAIQVAVGWSYCICSSLYFIFYCRSS